MCLSLCATQFSNLASVALLSAWSKRVFFLQTASDDGLHVNLSVFLQEVPLKIGRAGACVVVVKLPWAVIFPFFSPPSLSHNNIGNKWVEKQNKRSRTHPSRVAFSLFFPPFNSALQIFQREHRQSRDYKPLSLSLVDMPAHRGGLHILHILNRSRIFHGLG